MDKGCGGGVVVGGDDLGDGIQCSNHPYRSSPGGICAFCLQEKLGKLVSSSKSNPSFFPIPPSSSSSSPSFRSEGGGGLGSSLSLSLSLSVPPSSSSSSNCNNYRHPAGGVRSRIPFSVAHKKTKNTDVNSMVLKRSKSSAAPRRHHLSDVDDYSPRKRSGFWSFLHFPSSSSSSSSRRRGSCRDSKGDSKPSVHPTPTNPNSTSTHGAKDKCVGESSSSRRGDYGDENESPNSSHASSSSFGRKVARSRSVGCGSRSFSGDFLERISTGFGDCTLRRVESQREAKQASKAAVVLRGGVVGDEDRLDSYQQHHRMKERMKCGGIFGGFSMASSYWASEDMGGNSASSVTTVPHGRSKSWGWAFASPMRAFRQSSSSSSSKPEDKDSTGNAEKRSTNYQLQHSNNTDAADADAAVLVPNLATIPSLLTVRS